MTKYDHRRGELAKRPGMCYGYKDPMVKWEVEVRLYRYSTRLGVVIVPSCSRPGIMVSTCMAPYLMR